MPDSPFRHAHVVGSTRPWYKYVKPWKFILIFAAIACFLVGQSHIVDVQHAVVETYETMRGNRPVKKKPTKKPTVRPTPITPEYNEAATKAQTYVDTLHLSEEGLRDRLTSKTDDYTPDMAQYAIEKVHADYPNNALITAKELEQQGVTRPEDLMKKLTSAKYKFTPADAEFALRHLFPDQIVNSVLNREQ